MHYRFFNDRSFAKDAKMESCYQRQQKGKKYLPTKIWRQSSIIFNKMIIRIPVNAPKGQKLTAQGNTLGELDTHNAL